MNSSSHIDFLAPLPALPVFDETQMTQKTLPVFPPQFISSKQLRAYQLSQLDRADFFTYVIMGLAVLIAIVVPLLNLS